MVCQCFSFFSACFVSSTNAIIQYPQPDTFRLNLTPNILHKNKQTVIQDSYRAWKSMEKICSFSSLQKYRQKYFVC